jgi:hypothetical protein
MSDQAVDEDEYADEDDDLGPSLAIPPLYVVRTAVRCPECAKAMHVYTLGCTGYHVAGEGSQRQAFHFLSYVESVPKSLLKLLKAKCTGYFPDEEELPGTRYLMNHCPCGARIDDDFLHGDVGAAFFPSTPDGYRHFRLFTLPVEEPIPVIACGSVGGEDYLDFTKAEAW